MKFGIFSIIISTLFAFPISFMDEGVEKIELTKNQSVNKNNYTPNQFLSNDTELFFDAPVGFCNYDELNANFVEKKLDQNAVFEMKEYLHANYSIDRPVYIPYVLHVVDTDNDFDDKYATFLIDRFNVYNVPVALWRAQTITYQNSPNYGIVSVPYRLNIFLEEDVSQAWNPLYGYLIINNSFTNTNGWGLVHEFGHALGLAHIWGDVGLPNIYDGENVTRNPNDPCYNCETEGDGICDTPAAYCAAWGNDVTGDSNPPVNGQVTNFVGDCDDNLCSDPCTISYAQTFYDNCGVAIPNSNTVFYNIMNYGSRQCSQRFTPGQVSKIWNEGLPSYLTRYDIDLCLPKSGSTHLNCMNALSLTQSRSFERINTKLSMNLSNEDFTSGRKSVYNSKDIKMTPGFRATTSSNENDDVILTSKDPCSCSN